MTDQQDNTSKDPKEDAKVIPQTIDAVEEAKLNRDIETAKRRQDAMRKTAPAGNVTTSWQDPLKRFIRLHIPEACGPKAKVSVYTDAPDKHSLNIDRGYMPFKLNGEHARIPGGRDLVYTRPIEFRKRGFAEASKRSQARVEGPIDKTLAAAHGTEGLTVDQELTTITKGTVTGGRDGE